MSFSLARVATRNIVVLAALYGLPVVSNAMDIKLINDVMILSGEVVRPDLDRVKAEFAKRPSITHVVLRNSMGGNSWTGYRLGELFRERGVTTVVSGHCVSSCSRLFLGGKRRLFSSDFPQGLTYVGFHGHYDFGKLNPQAVEKNDQVAWTKQFTDNKVDPKLLNRWIKIERRAGDVRFYPDGVAPRWAANTFLCQGTESRRPNQCERISTNALKEGIVTSNEPFRSPDATSLLYGQREKNYPSSNFATLEDITKWPINTPRARSDYKLFLNAALPRALAVSSDGKVMSWRANSARSTDIALENCEKQSASRCSLYAVDERVVYVKP